MTKEWNALLCHPEGKIEAIQVDNYRQLADFVGDECNFVEMSYLGRYPLNDLVVSQTQEGLHLMFGMMKKVMSAHKKKDLTDEELTNIPSEEIGQVMAYTQIYVHEFGALIPLKKNLCFSSQLFGSVVILTVDCDDLPFQRGKKTG